MARRRREQEVYSGKGGVDAMTGNRVVWLRAPKRDSSTATACAQRGGGGVRVGGAGAEGGPNEEKLMSLLLEGKLRVRRQGDLELDFLAETGSWKGVVGCQMNVWGAYGGSNCGCLGEESAPHRGVLDRSYFTKIGI